MKKPESFPYHFLLIAAFQILSLYAINVNKIDISDALSILFLAVLLTSLLFLVILIITRNIQQSGVIATFYCFFFFIYGRLYEIFFGFVIAGLFVGRNKYLLPIFVIFLIAGTVFLFRSQWFKNTLNRITYLLNIFALSLVAISILMAVINFDWTLYGKKAKLQVKDDNITITTQQDKKTPESSGLKTPNVYFMIFDSYASPEVLRKYYGWNDHDLVDSLRSRGFTVNENAFCNYPFTILSINSYLNMGYIHEEPEFMNAKSKWGYMENRIEQNKVMSYFQSQGYNVVTTKTGNEKYKVQKENVIYNRVRSLFSNELMEAVIHTSLLFIIEFELRADFLRDTILSEISALSQADLPSIPTFYYSHILCPHQPYIFREDGSKPKIYESAWGKIENRNKYIAQVRFIGRKILEVVDSIRKRDPGAVIIVRSDHGHGNIVGNYLLNLGKPPLAFLESQYGILSATYLPIGISIPEKNTPVNLFRYLFNTLFNAKLEVLPDKAFFTPLDEPFDFHEVTNELIK